MADFRKWAASHCDVARLLGARMGLSEPVQHSLRHLYERWDGKGMPGELRAEQIPLAVRLMQVAQDADLAFQRGGAELTGHLLAERAGSGLDPQAVAAFAAAGDQVYLDMAAPSVWDEVMAAEPGPQPVVTEDRLDACLSAVADFSDLKSMWTVGHSRGVARLAGQAAAVAGLDAADIVLVRRAGLVHDIGRVAVPVGVWAKPGPLSRDEREQVRLHGYHSERVLDIVPRLRPLARLAGSHGERCDGSGYHRGSRAADLPLSAWILAAADSYHAMREPRPYRPGLSAEMAAAELSQASAGGKFAPEAVSAVLSAAGLPGSAAPRPAGLSERECEVLGLVARGLATKQVARQLGISPKTCDHHIQSLYAKTGVSTRAAATLFALEHGLVSTDTPSAAGPRPAR
jgi:HD-GYP domain-containing protein (c-di-GMP phosphodiesterase class II)/DNA-binding CsgD family transcriptional regulator